MCRVVQSTIDEYSSKSETKSRFFTQVKVKVLSKKVTSVKVKKVTMEKVTEVGSNFCEKKVFSRTADISPLPASNTVQCCTRTETTKL